MRKGYLTPPVLIVLALITLFVASTIFINTFLLKGLKKEPVPSPTPSIQPSPKSKTDETVYTEDSRTANWKTYTNPIVKYQISYPTNAKITKPNYTTIYDNPSDIIIDWDSCLAENGRECFDRVDIAIINATGQTLQSYVSKEAEDLSSYQDEKCPTKIAMVGEVKAIELDGCLVGDGSFLFLNKDDYIIKISASDNAIGNQILSTFKFVE